MGATPDQLTPEQIEREIERVRADLAATFTEIEQRVSPKRVVRENLQVVIGVGLVVTALIALKVARKHAS